jgi:uncharacterized protein (TIGR02147 family)
MIIGNYSDYRVLLKDCFESRIQKNPRYSLRAFARDLSIAPQNLSLILKEKKGISKETAVRIGKKLNLNSKEVNFLCDLVDVVHAKSLNTKKIAELRLSQYKRPSLEFKNISEDSLRIVSDWYHFAILELTYVKGFQSDSKWIAKRLGISVHQTSQAIDRLIRTQFLVKENGRYKKAAIHLTTSHEVSSEAIREFNRQVLKKAADALTFQSLAERDLTTMTMAIDVKKIPEAKEKIRKFRHELTEYLESGDRTEVYCLSTQLFRFTEKETGD